MASTLPNTRQANNPKHRTKRRKHDNIQLPFHAGERQRKNGSHARDHVNSVNVPRQMPLEKRGMLRKKLFSRDALEKSHGRQ